MLTNKKCNPKYPLLLLERLEKWGAQRGAHSIIIFTWNNRKGYDRVMKRLGFNTTGYIYDRVIQNET